MMRSINRYNFKIQVDGGVTLDNANELVLSGSDVLVAGNSVFSSKNPIETISKLTSFNR